MKLKLTLFFLFFLSKLAFAQNSNIGESLYFDPENNAVTKKEFYNIVNAREALVVKNDSLAIYKAITNRIEKGRIENYEEIIGKLEQTQPDIAFDKTKPLIVIFYPGKDPCNSSGSTDRQEHSILEKKMDKLAKVKPIYLYRIKEGMNPSETFLDWRKDPSNIIERTFFKYHYPCSSFVIIMPNGKYISNFAEFSMEILWKSLKELINEK